jgi:hypothetical protein
VATSPASLVCPECKTPHAGPSKRSFLGFTRFTCGRCGKTVLNPLSNGYQITYWVLLAIVVTSFVVNLLNGQLTFPGLLAIGILIALVRDMELRSRLRSSVSPP